MFAVAPGTNQSFWLIETYLMDVVVNYGTKYKVSPPPPASQFFMPLYFSSHFCYCLIKIQLPEKKSYRDG